MKAKCVSDPTERLNVSSAKILTIHANSSKSAYQPLLFLTMTFPIIGVELSRSVRDHQHHPLLHLNLTALLLPTLPMHTLFPYLLPPCHFLQYLCPCIQGSHDHVSGWHAVRKVRTDAGVNDGSLLTAT